MRIGLGTALLILFITLKLCGVIAWSWLWVLSPLWIIVLLALAYVALVAILVPAFEHRQ